MTVDEARTHYTRIMTVLKKERGMRDKFLGEPRRSQSLTEIDSAMSALESLGLVLADAAKAGVLTGGHEQPALIDVPPVQKQYL